MVTEVRCKRPLEIAAVLLFFASCNVKAPPPSTGGVQFGDAGAAPDGAGTSLDSGAESGGDAVAAAACDRGVVVVESDYQSTNVAVSRSDGTTLSGSFVSSGATAPGLSLALSGDVDVPFVAPASGRLVVLDRYGTDVVTWMDVDKAAVIAQLPVGQGFESNPHDYIEIDASHAWLSRYGSNPAPGKEPFDDGGDLLVLDTKVPKIAGRIAMPEEDPDLRPCPSEMVWVGGQVVVTLGRWSPDFSRAGDGRFVAVSPDTGSIAWTVDVAGLQSCGRVAVSPGGKLLAIACSGTYDFTTKLFDMSQSDIVLFDRTTSPPHEIGRLGIAKKLGVGIQPEPVFASENTLVVTTYGTDGGPGDAAYAVDVGTGDAMPLFRATQSYVLGGLRCSPGCGDICLLTDAERNSLLRWHIAPGPTFQRLDDVIVETIIGLPPRTLGGL